jgi:hypothetical protein
MPSFRVGPGSAQTQAIRAEVFQTHIKWAAEMKAVGVRFIAGRDSDTYSGFIRYDGRRPRIK